MLQQFVAGLRAEVPVAQRVEQGHPIKLLEFRRLVEEFHGDKFNPTAAESWIEELEKAFDAR